MAARMVRKSLRCQLIFPKWYDSSPQGFWSAPPPSGRFQPKGKRKITTWRNSMVNYKGNGSAVEIGKGW